jgi:hypothetical protein
MQTRGGRGSLRIADKADDRKSNIDKASVTYVRGNLDVNMKELAMKELAMVASFCLALCMSQDESRSRVGSWTDVT